MQFNTKFDIGDQVFHVWFTSEKTWQECAFCLGKGFIFGNNGESAACPRCHTRRGVWISGAKKWQVERTLTIGKIKIEYTGESEGMGNTIFDNYGPQKENYVESYQCYETGIGTGTIHDSEHLFKTKEEAHEYCDKMNKEEV